MKVILIDEIRGLGTRGDVVNVKDGYARNYLLPKNLAREATPGNLKSVEQERKKWPEGVRERGGQTMAPQSGAREAAVPQHVRTRVHSTIMFFYSR